MCHDSVTWQWGWGSGGVRMNVGVCVCVLRVSPNFAVERCRLYVTQASNLMRLMFPPSCSGSFDALRSSAEGLKSGGMDRLAGLPLPVAPPPPPPPPPPPAPPPPAAPASSRSLPSKELALLLTLSAGERPVGGSRHSREPGYCGGAVRMAPPVVEDGVVEDGGGQGVLRSRPGETGSDLMLTLEFVLTVSMAP